MAKIKSWFRFENKTEAEATLFLYDEIGAWGITAKDFTAELSGVTAGTINLRLNSPGGDVFDGFTIHNLLKEHPAKVKVQVDGLAASIASIIAMAGDEVRMAKNAFMMIHNAWSGLMGNAEDMRKMADTLDKIDGQLVKTYQDKTGSTQRDIRQMMADETWLTADEAVSKGFADSIGDPAEVKARFDLAKFANVPQAVMAMNTLPQEPATEREIEQLLRDAGASKKAALAAVAVIKGETLRDSEEEEAKKFKTYLEAEMLGQMLAA
ncbi:MAG: Clp protease ClpP [Geobacteraceae bacterium]|nr:Clp protease ClpP [Geobacteraceae bacterium]